MNALTYAFSIMKPFIKLIGEFTKGIIFLVSQPLVRWLGYGTTAVIVFGKALKFASKNKLVFIITSIITVIGWLVDKFKSFSSTTQVQLLKAALEFKKFEKIVNSVVEAILNKLSFLSKTPGFRWVDEAKDKFSKLKDASIKDLEELQAKIDELEKNPFKAGESPALKAPVEEKKKEEKEKKKKEEEAGGDNKEVEISAERAKRLEELEKEKNEAILQSQMDLIQGKTDLDALEEERLAINRDALLASLDEDYQTKLENQDLNNQQRLDLQKLYEEDKQSIYDNFNAKHSAKQAALNAFNLKVQAQADIMRVKAGKDLYTNLTASIDAFAQHNKAVARAQQVISAGETIVATYLGATKALAIGGGYPLGIPPMLATIAQGLGNLMTIKSQSFAVGAGEIPSDMMAQLHAGEMVVPATFAEGIRSGEIPLGGTGGTEGTGGSTSNITINFDGANFYGEMNDDALVEMGTRLGELINEDLLTPLPTGSA